MTAKPTNPKERLGIRKVSMSVVPVTVLSELAVGMTEGAVKYSPYNWREAGVRASVYYDATMRHLMRWWEKEDIDPDSKLSHLTKAICSLMVLRDGMIQGVMTDDRPDNNLVLGGFMEGLDKITAELMDKQLIEKQLIEEVEVGPQNDAHNVRVPDTTHIGPIMPTPSMGLEDRKTVTAAGQTVCRQVHPAFGNCTPLTCWCAKLSWSAGTGK